MIADRALDIGRLVIRPCLSPEENLPGFVHRAADANGISASSLWRHVVDELGKSDKAGNLVPMAMSGCTRAQADDLLGPGRSKRRWAVLPRVDVRECHVSRSAKICPKCIEADGVIRACWSLRLYVGCDRHRVWLLSRCGICGCPLTPFRPAASLCRCGSDLTAQELDILSDDETAILALVRGACKDSHVVSAVPSSPAELCLNDLLRLVVLVGGQGIVHQGTRLRTGEVGMARAVVSRAAPMFKDWPGNAIRLLRKILVEDPPGATPGMRYAGELLVNELNDTRRTQLSSHGRGLMLGVAMAAIEGHGFGRLNPRVIDMGAGSAEGYVSVAEAGRMSGRDTKRVKEKLRESAVHALPVLRPSQRISVYSRPEAELLAAQMREDSAVKARLVALKPLVALLGVSWKNVVSILELKLIRSEICDGLERYRIEDARKLLSDMDRAASGRIAAPDDVCPRNALSRYRNLSMKDLVEGVLSGRLRAAKPAMVPDPRAALGKLKGINAFRVEIDGLRRMNDELSRYITINEASKKLKISNEKVWDLIEAGLIERAPSDDRWPSWHTVSATSVDQFCLRYTTSSNLNRMFPTLRVARALRRIGASPHARSSAKFAVYPNSVVEMLREHERTGRSKRTVDRRDTPTDLEYAPSTSGRSDRFRSMC